MYRLPDTLENDIVQFAELADEYREKRVESVRFKAFRVPMGIYEQRRDESYMSRVRTTGGVIYPRQFLRLLDIAREHGSDLLHITTRQEIQLQNLELEKIESILRELRATGLATKGGGGNTVRNIMVSEDSGLYENEAFDTTPYAMELTSKRIAEPDSYLLPRKLKIAFSSDERRTGYAAVNDLGFVAKLKDGVRGFLVYVGGGGGAKPTIGWVLFDFVSADRLFAVVGAVKKFFSEHGNRKNRHKARLRFIFYRLGEVETLRLIKEYYEKALNSEPIFVPEAAEDERPAYSYARNEEVGTVPTEEYFTWKRRYVKAQKQRDYNSILIPVPLGNIRLTDDAATEALRKLLRLVDTFGKHTVRFTASQSIRLRNVPDAALPELYAIVKQLVAEPLAPVLTNNIVSCTGADTCRLGICLSKGLASALRRELSRSKLDLDALADARIHISGCPNSCGQQLWADIGFAGKILRNERVYPGYRVYLAASRDTAPKFAEAAGDISARDVPAFVHRLLGAYLEVQSDYKSLAAYLDTEGGVLARKLLAEYREVPSFADDKNYYFDWGAETAFSIVERGKAECSAGLFDMIEVDLETVNKSRAALETEKDGDARRRLLYGIVFSASRMLLVTRGAEPKTVADVFTLFLENFVDYGIVDGRFRELATIARDNGTYDFRLRENEIYALADTVTELYRNMDDSLQFKVVNIKEKVEENASADTENASADTVAKVKRKFKDLRGVACPMNFVQTKIQLSTMQRDEELEIWLDDGQPINNVPGSVRGEGHAILNQEQYENFWKVIIGKK